MSKRKILLQLDADRHASSFDAVVAVDAGVDQVLQYHGVEPTRVRDLVHGAMFTRGPRDLHCTAIFIGGADVAAGEALLQQVTDCFFGPLSVSVLLDANGANTTAVFSGIDPQSGAGYLYLETLGGGFGGRPGRDGKDGVQVHITNTSNLPVEAIEMEYPLLVESYGLIPDSGGAGPPAPCRPLPRTHKGVGRFVNRDPVNYVDSFNLYEYVHGNPVNYRDSSGLAWWWPPDWFGGGDDAEDDAEDAESVCGGCLGAGGVGGVGEVAGFAACVAEACQASNQEALYLRQYRMYEFGDPAKRKY